MVFGLAEKWLAEKRAASTFKQPEKQQAIANEEPAICVVEEEVIPTLPFRPKLIATTCAPLTETVSLKKLGIQLVFVDKLSDVAEVLRGLLGCKAPLGIDIETYGLPAFLGDKQAGLDPRKSAIRTVQLYDGGEVVYVFDILKLGGLSGLGEQLWDRPMVAHNAMFELKQLMYAGVFPKKLGCTLLLDRVITGQRQELKPSLGLSKKASLKALAKEILDLEISKEQQVSDWTADTLSIEQVEYAALDAVLVFKLFHKQWDALQSKNLTRAYGLLRDVQTAVVRMELCGIGFDIVRHRQLIEEWKQESETLKKSVVDSLGIDLNINSSKQLNSWLKEALKQEDLEAWAKTDKGQLSTSTHTFKLHEHMHDVFPKLVAYRHVAKRLSSFGANLYKYVSVAENRLYGSFALGATNTGRMASRNPNMQQMPRDGFRSLFVAAPGYQLVRLDYSQQELRVAALTTGDQTLLKIYAEGGDIHRATAAALLKIPSDEVTKEQRQLAKAVIFGLLYGQGATGLARYAKRQYGVEMSVEEAERHRGGLFKTYPGLKRWQWETGDRTKLLQKISTPCGRIRDFSRELRGYQYCAALNHPIQGAAAEITLHALIRLAPSLCDDGHLVNVIHDEILLEVREDRIAEFKALAEAAMTQAFLDVFPNSAPYLKNVVEAGVGFNWETAH